MVRTIGKASMAGAGVCAVALAALVATGGIARAADDLPVDREEIIVTHQRLGPLSDWAQMQQHSADYKRLKEKFDPSSSGAPHYDPYTSASGFAAPVQPSHDFEHESAEQPTPAAVQAVEDGISPP
jgi:hypothetical protein